MSDRIGVLKAGRFIQVGTPEDIYSRPENRFVSEFMGDVNVIPVQRQDDGTLLSKPSARRSRRRPFPTASASGYLVVRPEALRFVAKASDADNVIPGKLYNEYALGSRVQYQVRIRRPCADRRTAAPADLPSRARRRGRCRMGRERQRAGGGLMEPTAPHGCRRASFRTAADHRAARRLRRAARSPWSPTASCRRALSASIHRPTLANYVEIFSSNSYIALYWSLIFAVLTVVILALSAIRSPTAWPACSGAGRPSSCSCSPSRCSSRKMSGSMAGYCSSSRTACCWAR